MTNGAYFSARCGPDIRRLARCGVGVAAIVVVGFAMSSCTLRDKFLPQSAADDPPATAAQVQARAEAGDAEQQYRLGMRYLKGDGVEKDEAEAARWFEIAANGGHAISQYLVGVAYYAAKGRARDYGLALEWFEKAARQGHARAQYLLGDAHANGRGVPADPAWAARWYGKAAEQGHAEAQFYAGALNGAGLGVPQDTARSYLWLSLAAGQNHELAEQARVNVAKSLTRQQRIRADAAVKRWAPTTPKFYADRPTVRYVQYALQRLGHPVGAIDGVQGPRTFTAIAAYQTAAGMVRDRAVSRSLVERLRADTIKRK